MRKNVIYILIILIISFLSYMPLVKARSFADFDDETADAEAKEQLEQQEKEHEANIGKSSNNYLSELSIKEYILTPSFDKQIIDYEIKEKIESDSIEINTKLDDSKAKVAGDGIVHLQTGENIINIEVTAENGTVRTYHIKVNKKIGKDTVKLDNLKLFAVNIRGEKETLDIIPEFSRDTFFYTCKVNNDITKIDVEALSTENQTVKVEGNENLQVGPNEIRISVISNENTENIIYKINVIKKEAINSAEGKSISIGNNKIIIGIIIVLIIAVVLGKGRKKSSRH